MATDILPCPVVYTVKYSLLAQRFRSIIYLIVFKS